jgi:hypothetical protein
LAAATVFPGFIIGGTLGGLVVSIVKDMEGPLNEEIAISAILAGIFFVTLAMLTALAALLAALAAFFTRKIKVWRKGQDA